MEVIGVELLKMIGLGGRLEQHAAQLGVVVHRSAGVHQQQHLDGVFPGILILDLQHPRVLAGIVDRVIHIQLLVDTVILYRQLPQRPEGHLELAGIQFVVLPEIPV